MVAVSAESFQAIFEMPRPDGGFDGQTRLHLRRLGHKRPLVLLAFPPKAAGTFLREAALRAVNGQLVRLVHAQGGRDGQIYMPTLIAYYHGAMPDRVLVGHVHMQALPANIQMLETFDIRPVIMVRAIPDMLASYWDMLEVDPVARTEGLNCLIPPNFLEMSRAAKADFMVDIMGPWYASYFATWMAYAETDPDRVCVLHYRDFKADPVEALETALEHAGFNCSPERCETAIEIARSKPAETRFNKGRSGRGASYFGPEHLARIERQLGHYANLAPHMDELLGRGAFAASRAA